MDPTADHKQRAPTSGRWALLLLLVLGGCSNTSTVPSMEQYLTIVTRVGSYDEAIRRDAIRQIRSHPREPTVAAIKTILEEGSWDLRVRVTLAAILATWPDEHSGEIDKSGLPDLIEALRGNEASLRRMAVDTLPLMGRDAVRYVQDVLVSGDKPNRMDAAVILGMMLQENQEASAGRALAEADLSSEVDPEVRMAVVINLAEWRSPQAIPAFIDALTDPNEQIRAFAWAQITARSEPPVEFRIHGDFPDRASAIQKLRAWWKDTGRDSRWSARS
jgi:HEAT repeat protein